MVTAEQVTKSFGNLQVLKGISLHVDPAEVVSIVGPSGAGKTTLLQILGTLGKQDGGIVTINGIRTDQLPNNQLARFRNSHIGFVFQFHQLLPEFTAVENVCIPGFIAGRQRKEVEHRAGELLEFLGLKNRLEHKPGELSGGEQQRVAVARALINDPEVMLADEPSGNLDTENKKELHKLFMTLRERFEKTLIIVTHDRELAGMADRIITMKDGRIEQ